MTDNSFQEWASTSEPPETAKLPNDPQSGLKMCFEISFFNYAAQLDKWALEDRQVVLVSLRIVVPKQGLNRRFFTPGIMEAEACSCRGHVKCLLGVHRVMHVCVAWARDRF